MDALQIEELALQFVVFGVGQLGAILDVIAFVVMANAGAQLSHARCGLWIRF